jgi:hypothetical protein
MPTLQKVHVFAVSAPAAGKEQRRIQCARGTSAGGVLAAVAKLPSQPPTVPDVDHRVDGNPDDAPSE